MKILFAVMLVNLAALPALARQTPTPPPSGVVIHLFGPNSVTSQILPGAAASSPGGTTQTGTAANAQAAPEPTFGDVFHQMFVTGDPAQDSKPRFAPGRNGAF